MYKIEKAEEPKPFGEKYPVHMAPVVITVDTIHDYRCAIGAIYTHSEYCTDWEDFCYSLYYSHGVTVSEQYKELGENEFRITLYVIQESDLTDLDVVPTIPLLMSAADEVVAKIEQNMTPFKGED